MLKHKSIWSAIDRIAQRKGISVSALARSANLDPTTFNKSKRIAGEGKPRWPTTESISKVLHASGMSFTDFAAMVEGIDFTHLLPVVPFNDARNPVLYDQQGYPTGPGWDQQRHAGAVAPNAFGLSLTDHRFSPVYREGDLLVISPTANLRLGDRVAVLAQGDVLEIGNLKRRTALGVEFVDINNEKSPQYVASNQLIWTARITHCLFRA